MRRISRVNSSCACCWFIKPVVRLQYARYLSYAYIYGDWLFWLCVKSGNVNLTTITLIHKSGQHGQPE